jgi:hypothetical protein
LTFDLTYEKKGGDNGTINHSKELARACQNKQGQYQDVRKLGSGTSTYANQSRSSNFKSNAITEPEFAGISILGEHSCLLLK